MFSLSRDLTQSEIKVLSFLRKYEELVDNRRVCTKLYMGGNAIEAMSKGDIAKPLRVEFDTKEKLYRVTMLLDQFVRYLAFCCKQVGITVCIDGSAVTYDDELIPYQVILDGTYLPKGKDE